METESAGGSTWAFEPTAEKGQGYWYRIGAGRFDADGRAFGNLRKLPYGGGRDVMICPPGITPSGRKSPPSFPILRYAAQIDSRADDKPLGLAWGFRHLHKGKGHPDDIGISWTDEEGRARGRFLLRLTSGFKGIIIICPPGIEPPPGPYPPAVILPGTPGAEKEENGDENEGDEG